jgi:archaellum component FlaF (FlaF/FlaG flagellin family)
VEGPAGFVPRVVGGVCSLVDGALQLAVEKAGGECAVTMTHVVKFVNVVEGGTRSPYSWGLRVGDILVYHNRTVLLAPGVYTPTLQGSIPTYRLVEARDACALDPVDQTLTLTAPGNGLCTVVHRRTTGTVTFKRIVQGGNAQPSEWVTMVNGQPMPLDTPVTLDTNTYTVIEAGPPDYVVTAASGICALDKGQIKLTVTEEGGECGLISTRGIGPVGFVMYPGGGTAQASEWSFIVNGQVVPHNGALLMPVGLYTVTVQGPAGYTVIGASGICVLTESHDVQMTVGVEGGSCNLQSAYDASGVGAVSFYAAPSDDAPPELWNFVANGQPVDHGQTLLMPVGAYTVTVNSPAGYHVAGATGVCALVDGAVRLTVTVFGGSCTVQTAPDAAPPPQADFALYLPAVTR